MSAILPLLMLTILLVVIAMCYNEGIWSNAIRLVNVVTAALLATNFFEPAADWLDHQDPAGTYVWDFASLWGLFIVFLLIFRVLTDSVSRVKVRFLKVADRPGGALLSFFVGWAMVCFTMTTLHTAPLGYTFLWGGFSTDAEEKMVFGTGPDRMWLGFVKNLSTGAFGRSEASHEFNPGDEFMRKYASRRKLLEENVAKKDSLRAGP